MAQQEGTLMASLTGIVFLGKNMFHLIERLGVAGIAMTSK